MKKSVYNRGKSTIITPDGDLNPGAALDVNEKLAEKMVRMYPHVVFTDTLSKTCGSKALAEIKKELAKEKKAHAETKAKMEQSATLPTSVKKEREAHAATKELLVNEKIKREEVEAELADVQKQLAEAQQQLSVVQI